MHRILINCSILISSVPYLTEEEAKQALAQFVSEHCCYGSGPVKNLTISNMQSSNTYRVNFLVFDKYVQLIGYGALYILKILKYVLETYTESRSTEYIHGDKNQNLNCFFLRFNNFFLISNFK